MKKKRGEGRDRTGWDGMGVLAPEFPPAKQPSSSIFSLGTASHALVTPELVGFDLIPVN